MRFALALSLFAALASAAVTAAANAHVDTRPQVSIVANAHSFAATGLRNLHAGYVDVTVRDAGPLTHGAGLIRLDDPGMTPARAAKIIAGDNLPAHLGFTLLGGVPQLSHGQSWHGAFKLTPGRYVFFDDGENGKGMMRPFTVGAATGTSAPPRAVGTVELRDFAFVWHLPKNWNGRGIVEVPNRGAEIHELTFIKVHNQAEARKWSAILAKGYPQGPPPKGDPMTFAACGQSPGQTSWVKLHLEPGIYLAVCLFPDPKTHKPHTALGMLSTITVR